MLQEGKRAVGWRFDLNIESAEKKGYPNVALLKALAEVIAGDKNLASLETFPEWKKA